MTTITMANQKSWDATQAPFSWSVDYDYEPGLPWHFIIDRRGQGEPHVRLEHNSPHTVWALHACKQTVIFAPELAFLTTPGENQTRLERLMSPNGLLGRLVRDLIRGGGHEGGPAGHKAYHALISTLDPDAGFSRFKYDCGKLLDRMPAIRSKVDLDWTPGAAELTDRGHDITDPAFWVADPAAQFARTMTGPADDALMGELVGEGFLQ